MADPAFEQTPPGTAVDVPDELIGGPGDQPLGDAEQNLLQALAEASAAPEASPSQPPAAGNGPQNPAAPPPPASAPPLRAEAAPRTDDLIRTDAATLAVELTQHVVGSTAQAIILLKDNAVITAAGSLSQPDIATLAEAIDCRTVNSRGGTQIKFVALRTTNTNYMVVAVPTLDEMVLVLVSAENTHLGTIRQEALGLAGPPQSAPARRPKSPRAGSGTA
jgi:hypothetical protein